MSARPSAWWQAVRVLLEVCCPFCGESRSLDHNELGWHCDVCGKSWTATGDADR